jgi:cobalt/nickel transport system permease protein
MQARHHVLALLAFLILVSFTPLPGLLVFAAVLLAWAPARRMAWRAALVLPFSVVLAATAWWSGGAASAILLLAKSYVSVLAVLAFNAVTPAWAWIAVLRNWRVPPALVDVLQLVHRYLFVLAGEAGRMRTAATARGGFRFDAAAGAVGVLFARSWQRGERVHRAMLARGHSGSAL